MLLGLLCSFLHREAPQFRAISGFRYLYILFNYLFFFYRYSFLPIKGVCNVLFSLYRKILHCPNKNLFSPLFVPIPFRRVGHPPQIDVPDSPTFRDLLFPSPFPLALLSPPRESTQVCYSYYVHPTRWVSYFPEPPPSVIFSFPFTRFDPWCPVPRAFRLHGSALFFLFDPSPTPSFCLFSPFAKFFPSGR